MMTMLNSIQFGGVKFGDMVQYRHNIMHMHTVENLWMYRQIAKLNSLLNIHNIMIIIYLL